MPCYSPMKAFDSGDYHKSGKPMKKILPFSVEKYNGLKGVPISCGKCIGCRLDYSREWAIRSYFESKQ